MDQAELKACFKRVCMPDNSKDWYTNAIKKEPVAAVISAMHTYWTDRAKQKKLFLDSDRLDMPPSMK